MNRNPLLLMLLLVGLLLSPISIGLAQEAPDEAAPPPGDQAEELEAEIERLGAEVQAQWQEIENLFLRYTEAEGDDRLVIDAQIVRREKGFLDALTALIDSLTALEATGRAAPGGRAIAEELLESAGDLIGREVNSIRDRIAILRAERQGASAGDLLGIERRLTRAYTDLDDHIRALLIIADYDEAIGHDVSADLAAIDDRLETRAVELASLLDVATSRAAEVELRLASAEGSEREELRSELRALDERRHRATSSLGSIVEMMDQRDLSTTEYKQLLIRSTGTVTTDILDTEVAVGLAREGWESLTRWIVTRAPQMFFNILLFLFILFLFRLLARFTERVVNHTLARTQAKVPDLLKNMAAILVSRLVLLIGLLIALSQLGFEVGPLLAGLGVVGFIVGFALQDTLSNFAAGIMILVYRPFDVGDVIEAGGVAGKVDHMSLVSTMILTFDNQRLVVPNNKIWGDVIRNKTAEKTRRVDMVFPISYSDDVERAERVLGDILKSHELVLDDPEPMLKLHELDDSGVNFVVRPWVKTEDYWTVYWDVTRRVHARFAEEGLTIPFPQRDLHIREKDAPGSAAA